MLPPLGWLAFVAVWESGYPGAGPWVPSRGTGRHSFKEDAAAAAPATSGLGGGSEVFFTVYPPQTYL